MEQSIEIKKAVPVLDSVDVLVVGAGIAGSTAAIAAARNGAKTALVDRFGYPGGNMGPGLIGGAPNLELPEPLAGGLPGIPGEFVRRCEEYCNARLLNHYFRDSHVIAYVFLKMLEEAGVQTVFNTFAGDPIMDGDTVTGLIVENKSGTRAIKAKVIIDATGDADVAARAGAPVDSGRDYFHPGMSFALGNVNIKEYSGLFDKEPDPEDSRWAAACSEHVSISRAHHLKPLLPYIRAAWESGDYRFVQEVDGLGYVMCDHGIFRSVSGVQYVPDPISDQEYGIVGAMVGVSSSGLNETSGNAEVMNRLEQFCRKYIFETAQFLKKRVPGFEKSYLHFIAPYFHARGGRSIISEYYLKQEDVEEERRQDDAIFRAYTGLPKTRIGKEVYGYPPAKKFDFPYRQLLPRKIEGLLAAGRSAIKQPPVTRVRWMVLLMGQAAGLAAALSARSNTVPRKLDVEKLQSILSDKYQVEL